MSPLAKKVGYLVQSLGLDPRKTAASLPSVGPFLRNYAAARKQAGKDWPLEMFPALGDRAEQAGSARGHYFHMDLWAARHVFEGKFEKLVDVGSRVDGYVAHILTFRDIECFDVRPMASSVKGLSFRQADLMQKEGLPQDYADCVSSLHALEHFGLGRYGDPLDLDGWRKGLAGLAQLARSGGALLLAVPVGRQRIEFDAHRVFDPQTIVDEAARNGLVLKEFCVVDDSGDFHAAGDVAFARAQSYGCGCFKFERA